MPILPALMPKSPPATLDQYDVVWSSPSPDAAGAMPIGNGEVVLNVWVEQATGDLLFYIARSDSLSEVSRYLKLGRVRMHFSPAPFTGSDIRQRLHLRDGTIELSGGGAHLVIFVDAASDVIHVFGASSNPLGLTAAVECWRNAPRTIPKAEQGSAWSVHDAPFPLVESPDVFLAPRPSGPPEVTWFHRNETSVVPKLWANQSLTGLPGRFDPILHRTFGGCMTGLGMVTRSDRSLATLRPRREFDLRIATASAQTRSVAEWRHRVVAELNKSELRLAVARTQKWWNDFWGRSWVLAEGDSIAEPVPSNTYPLRRGLDSNAQNAFPGEIRKWQFETTAEAPAIASILPLQESVLGPDIDFSRGLTLAAEIKPDRLVPGRIFDKMTAGGSDGFIFDTHPGDRLRLIVGRMTLTAPKCLVPNEWQRVAATYDPKTGEAALFWNGRIVAHREPQSGSPITRGYLLQRYVQACQGRGAYPIKFNGGFYTVEPAAMGEPYDPDWRRWGDSHWWQNVRHMYHPMAAQGDFEMTAPLFHLYESAVPLAKARTKAYHGVEGVYFPETMTLFGTYSGGDYGWDRKGHQPKDVLCPWWQYAWNQGLELVALMLDQWDYTRDQAFLKREVLPMADEVLRYFDTRFKKDSKGRIVLDPTQVVETYWQGVVNDMPSTAGLISVTKRLSQLPNRLVDVRRRAFYRHMKASCPELPLGSRDGHRQLAPAQKYVPKTSNVENGELYAVWPFRLVSLSHPVYLTEAKSAYAHRLNHLDTGWGYDGNVAALLGMTEEAARILQVKCANSNPAYRWPATWGPNFDWLPDQNHGGNLLETANLMLIQSDPLEEGGAIRLLPAWPKEWSVDFKLHAAGNTLVHCRAAKGRILELEVTPGTRMRNVVWPSGWKH